MQNAQTWFITGVSSGFGLELTKLLLSAGKTVVGTVRKKESVENLIQSYPKTFDCRLLDVTDSDAVYATIQAAIEDHKKIDVIVSNAGYGLFGCAEELTVEQINHITATNLLGSIHVIKAFLPHMRENHHGRIIQISSYGGQVAYPSNSMYHATKFGIEGFCESVAQEVKKFGVGLTIVEPGGARTEFRYGSAKVAHLMHEYEHCHGFLNMLDPTKGLAPGDPALMAKRIIESVSMEPAPLHMVLGSQALKATIERLETRLGEYKTQMQIAASTDFKE